MRRKFLQILGMAWASAARPAWALEAASFTQIRPGSILTLQVHAGDNEAPAPESVQIRKVDRIVTKDEADGWLLVHATRSDTSPLLVVLHPTWSKDVAEIVVQHLKLADLGLNRKALDRMDQEKKGVIEFENQHYLYVDDDSEDGQHVEADQTTEMSFYRFECQEDDDMALMVLEYPNRMLVWQLQWTNPEQIKLS